MVIIQLALKMNKMSREILLGLVFVLPLNVWACSCIGTNNVKQELKESDLVFSGKILSKNVFTVNDNNLPSGFDLKKAEYIVLISEIYKGHLTNDTLNVITGVGGGDCGLEFSVGVDYIIYAAYKNKYFERGQQIKRFVFTNICTRTKPIDKNEIRKIKRFLKN